MKTKQFHGSFTLTTSPTDPDFEADLKLLNGINPAQAVDITFIKTRCGAYLAETREVAVALIQVKFNRPMMDRPSGLMRFQSVKIRPQYQDKKARGVPRIIDCDGHRLEETLIDWIGVDFKPYDPYAVPSKKEG